MIAAGNAVATEVATQPAYLYALTFISVAGLLFGLIRSESDKFSKWLAGWRRASQDKEDSRIGDQAEQIASLQTWRGEQNAAMKEVRDENAHYRSFLLAMTAHVWDWRHRHVAAGSPYEPPKSPTGPIGITDLLPVWPTVEPKKETHNGN